MAYRKSTTRGFKSTGSVLGERIRRAGESRGFAVSRLLTHWDSVVGPDIAAIARPASVNYGRGGFGATLVILTTGAHAPMLEMQKEKLRTKVNAIYGYNAIARVRITQTAATGFAAGNASAPPRAEPTGPSPQASSAARAMTGPVRDDSLRRALETLGAHVLGKPHS